MASWYNIPYMGLFSSESKSRLGIDIGTAAIKIVELTKDSNRFTLTNYGMFELESGSEAKLDNKQMAEGIKDVLRSSGMTSTDVIASIPSFPTFATTITLPYLSEEEIAKAMPFEARKYIPVPLSEVQLDWAIVNVRKDQKEAIVESKDAMKGKPTVDVFLVAVPKQEVARYQTAMKDAGLNLRALELESFALIRALIGNDLSTIVIINIGGGRTSIFFVEDGFPRGKQDH